MTRAPTSSRTSGRRSTCGVVASSIFCRSPEKLSDISVSCCIGHAPWRPRAFTLRWLRYAGLPRRGRSRRCRWYFEFSARRNPRRSACRCEGKRYDLLLHARLVAVLHVVVAFGISSLVGRKDAALHAFLERADAILEVRAQQRDGVELDILVGLALELEGEVERFLDVVQAEAQAARDPAGDHR